MKYVMVVALLATGGTSAAQKPATPAVHTLGFSLLLPVAGSPADDFGYPNQTIDRLAVRRLLMDRAYDALDTVLTAYADSARRDYRLEYRLFDAYGAFEVAVPWLAPRLNEWVQLRPGSAAALLARATFLAACGWHARGTAWAGDTPPEQFALMGAFFRDAMADVAAALSRTPNSMVAYRELMNLARSLGDIPASRKALDQALKIQPYSFLLRASHMYILEPRWGGSYQAMTDFASESAPYWDRNPRLQALQGFGDWDRGRVLAAAGEKVEALQEFQEALRFGDLGLFRYERGLFYSISERYAEALEDFTSALLQRPQHPDALFHRAIAEYNLGLKASDNTKGASFSQAFRDLELAVELDPTEQGYQQLLAQLRQSVPEFDPRRP